MPQRHTFGDWATSPADSLIPVIAQMGRHYLPWVAAATVDGSATVRIGEHEIEIRSSNFLDNARGVLLARYAEARSDELDTVLDAAGVLPYFADYLDQATAVRTRPHRPSQATTGPTESTAESPGQPMLSCGGDPSTAFLDARPRRARGSPSTRSPIELRNTSSVPPAID